MGTQQGGEGAGLGAVLRAADFFGMGLGRKLTVWRCGIVVGDTWSPDDAV